MPITVEQSDNGASVEVQQGDLLIVRLKENPTTGFRWAVNEINERVLQLQDSDYAQMPGGGIGAGGERALAFRAQGSGTSPLSLKLRREWEGDATASESFSVTVRVI